MRVLGIDPGLTRCGIGVVDVAPNRRATLVYVGVVQTSPESPLADRLLAVSLGIREVLGEYRPTAMAVERVFAQHNLRTVMGTAQASGIALALGAEHGLAVGLHTPSEVKAAITGYGAADKAQVGAMVARVLGLDAVPTPADAADALALAICHAWRGGFDTRPAAGRSSTGGSDTPAQRAWRDAEKSTANVGWRHDRLGPRHRAHGVGHRRRHRRRGSRARGPGDAAARAHAARRVRGHVHTALIVRDDDLSLFGFATRAELEVFDLLRGVSGVGPKSALGVLSTLSPDEVARAVAMEDDVPFRKVSGIGPKTAKLIAVSLQGKLLAPAASGASSIAAAPTSISANVIAALVGLGWNERVAAQAVDEVAANASDDERESVQALLRLSLAALGPGVRA